MELCDPYFWENPKYIVHSLRTSKRQCASHMVNRVFAVYILALIAGFVFTTILKCDKMYMVVGVLATIFLLPTFVSLKHIQEKKEGHTEGHTEGFQSDEFALASDLAKMPVQRIQASDDAGMPFQESINEVRNPFHNITVDQYSYAPTRDPAPSVQTAEAKESMDAMFRVQWTSDPTDVFGKTQSQRMFVTQPITTIPNDQQSYQDWLYKIPGKTCKEGNSEACYGGTNGAALPWLNL